MPNIAANRRIKQALGWAHRQANPHAVGRPEEHDNENRHHRRGLARRHCWQSLDQSRPPGPLSSRHPEKQQRAAAALGPLAFGGTIEEAAAFGEVVLISVPYRALEALGESLRVLLASKIVLDACNPYPPDPATLISEVEAEGVAQASARLLPGVRLVRAFSAVDATAIEASAAGRGQRLGVPLASDDPEAMQVADQLVRDAGCDPVTVGDLAAGRRFQRGGAGFRAHLGAPALRCTLGLH
jgi:predicted dinucleotide-binding enzyme